MAYERKTYDLFISDELRDVLLEFESESEVAALLLKKRHDKEDLVENPINFVSISRDDNTKISYLTPDRMSTIDINEYWTTSRRFQAKPGAFISKIFKNVSGKEVEKFSNLYRANVNKPKFTFEVVKGSRIKDFYHYDSYAKDRGTLGASCMKHDSCQEMLYIYSENPDVISMLIMKDDWGRLMGRALLWNFESYKIMDRIYTISDEDLPFYFKTWATKNGYLYKSEQNWFNTLNFEQMGQKRQELHLKVKLTNFAYRRYPYIDTFKFFNPKTGELTNYMPTGYSYKTLCSSDGSMYDYDYLVFDGIDRVLRYKGDVVRIDYLNIFTHSNNAQWSEVNDQYILNKHSRYDDEIQDVVFAGDYEEKNNTLSIKSRREYFSKSDSDRNMNVRQAAQLAIEELGLDLNNDMMDRLLNGSLSPTEIFRSVRPRSRRPDLDPSDVAWGSEQ